MTLEANLYENLKNDSGVAALVADRIYVAIAPQEAIMPAIIFHIISTVPENGLSGFLGLDKVRVQVDAWAKTYKEARNIQIAARLAIAASTVFKAICIESREQQYEPQTKHYAISSDWYIWDRHT
jgi:hypothetical protein